MFDDDQDDSEDQETRFTAGLPSRVDLSYTSYVALSAAKTSGTELSAGDINSEQFSTSGLAEDENKKSLQNGQPAKASARLSAVRKRRGFNKHGTSKGFASAPDATNAKIACQRHFMPSITFNRKSILTVDENRKLLAMHINQQKKGSFMYRDNRKYFDELQQALQTEFELHNRFCRMFYKNLWEKDAPTCPMSRRPPSSLRFIIDRQKSAYTNRLIESAISTDYRVHTTFSTDPDTLKQQSPSLLTWQRCVHQVGTFPKVLVPDMRSRNAAVVDYDKVKSRYNPSACQTAWNLSDDPIANGLAPPNEAVVTCSPCALQWLLLPPEIAGFWMIPLTVKKVYCDGIRRKYLVFDKPLPRSRLTNRDITERFFKYGLRAQFIRPLHDVSKVEAYRRMAAAAKAVNKHATLGSKQSNAELSAFSGDWVSDIGKKEEATTVSTRMINGTVSSEPGGSVTELESIPWVSCGHASSQADDDSDIDDCLHVDEEAEHANTNDEEKDKVLEPPLHVKAEPSEPWDVKAPVSLKSEPGAGGLSAVGSSGCATAVVVSTAAIKAEIKCEPPSDSEVAPKSVKIKSEPEVNNHPQSEFKRVVKVKSEPLPPTPEPAVGCSPSVNGSSPGKCEPLPFDPSALLSELAGTSLHMTNSELSAASNNTSSKITSGPDHSDVRSLVQAKANIDASIGAQPPELRRSTVPIATEPGANYPTPPAASVASISYDTWWFGNHTLLVRSKLDGRMNMEGEPEVFFAAKAEYVCDFGGQRIPQDELMRLWVKCILKKAKHVFLARMHPLTGEILSFELVTPEALAKQVDRAILERGFAYFDKTLSELFSLDEGSYVLRHEEGSNSTEILKPCEKEAEDAKSDEHIADDDESASETPRVSIKSAVKPDDLSNNFVNCIQHLDFDAHYRPIDPSVIFQYHKVIKRYPGTLDVRAEEELPETLEDRKRPLVLPKVSVTYFDPYQKKTVTAMSSCYHPAHFSKKGKGGGNKRKFGQKGGGQMHHSEKRAKLTEHPDLDAPPPS